MLKNRLRMRKIVSRWIPQDTTEAQRWMGYNVAQTYLVMMETFLRRRISMLRLMGHGPDRMNLNLRANQSSEWLLYGSPLKTKVPHTPTKVMVIDVYDSDGVMLT